MNADANADKMTPAQITALLDSLPPRVLLEFIKGDALFAQTIFHGFTVRDNSLKNPVIRTRLKQELGKLPEMAQELRKIWDEANVDLLATLESDEFIVDGESLSALATEHGEATLRFALLCDARDEVVIWAEKLDKVKVISAAPLVKKPVFSSLPSQANDVAARAQIVTLQKQLLETQQQLAKQRTEIDRQKNAITIAEKHSEEIQRKLNEATKVAKEKLERETRRAKKAEEEAQELRKQLRAAEKKVAESSQPAAPAALNSAAAKVVAEAIALLQRGLELSVSPSSSSASGKVAAVAVTPVVKVAAKKAEPAIELPTTRGKKSYPLRQVKAAFVSNNQKVVDEIRDALTRLTAPLERTALAELARVQIPEAVLRGPLRPALIDGSNVANMNKDKRARLAYLGQVQQSAWAEGYFPVLIYADASLPHQIDNPDLFLQLVERGDIIMTEAGTSADETLIKEARRLGAIIITNDRMNDWPDARHLDRRHVEIINGTARVGDFQRNSVNFNY